MSLIRDHVWAGVGRGAFEGPIARYRTHSEGIRLAYPEALPLQIASEWGVPFALMFACAASFAFVRLLPWLKHVDVAAQAAAVGVGAVLLQDLVGFALELTGVAVPVLVAAAVAVGRIEDRRDPDRQAAKRLSKRVLLPAAALSAACAVAALWAQPRTAWVEGERLQRVVASGAPATQALAAAMQRHPTDPYLALLAHIDARAHAPEQAERHLDRARRLFPADGTVDQAAARWMVQRGLPAQAALAYRSAAEHGMVTDPAELYRNVGVSLMAEAVPQTQQALWAVARFMLDAGHVEAAIHASARAVDAAADKTHAALDRLHLASRSGSEAFVRDAAEDVMLAADTPAGFVVAADALDRATQKREAIDAITRGLRRHPSAAPLVIKGAALHLAYDELDAANALLRLPAVRHFEVPDQIRVQELLATLADRRGDLVGAVTARARARVLSAAGGDRTRRR